MSLIGSINKRWIRITGSNAEFPLEVRIFHSVCIIVIAALGYNVPFNFFIGLPIIAELSLATLVLFGFLYYLSRYLGKTKPAIFVFAIAGNLLFAVNFMLNSGTWGPTELLMSLCVLLLLCIVPKKQHRVWVAFNSAIVIGLNCFEYYYPRQIPYTYDSRQSRFFDLTSAYIVVVIVVYYTITYLRRNYDHEKRSSAEKANSIEKKNEQIVRQNRELERINQERNKLMSIIAHDLRSPLSNIQNYLELVTEYDLDSAERQLVEDDLLKVTGRTIDMLGKLLVWSKGQMDGVNVNLGSISLRTALFSTLELERSIASKKEISLVADLEWDTKIVADSDMLQLVIRNLISNAIKFTNPGGRISVKAKHIGNECWLIIRDSGIGIAPGKQAELFTLRAGATFGTNQEKGVGLGLLLCKEFTELQGGRIWMESTPGEGTSFYVSMPAVTS
ncbi:two-component sensor histidine kinase [Mucilaginibacter sp. PAMC 26640]|nr:two-component sensor histidine kinase [Mucilaginibacter sp. PAMC 26640]